MTGGLSLRARLLAGLGVVIVLLVVVAASVISLTRRHLVSQVDERLEQAVDFRISRPPAAGNSTDDSDVPGPLEERIRNAMFSDIWEGSYDSSGTLEERGGPSYGPSMGYTPAISYDEAFAVDDGDPISVGSVEAGGGRWRVAVQGDSSGGLTVLALPLDGVDDTVHRLIFVELIASGAVIAVLVAVGWWVIRLGIRPIKQMTATATAIADGDLSHRVPDMAPSTEAGQLGLALNHMLEQLEQSFDARALSQERLQQFVADASHELRTPVTTIRGYAELYRLGGLSRESEVGEAMRRTEQEAVRMSRLVDDMLTLAKLGAGRPLEFHDVDLAQLVADAGADARAVAPDRTVTVDASGPVLVRGDEDRLRQVIANVVSNALTHTPAGTPIELRAAVTGTDAEIAITDHGPGMAPEVASKVTERFYRADPARARDRGGSGLGLAIVDATVTAHGGSIIVASAIGAGTTVRVSLPRLSVPVPQRTDTGPAVKEA
jgi:two-component system OmpR family sensor kinase